MAHCRKFQLKNSVRGTIKLVSCIAHFCWGTISWINQLVFENLLNDPEAKGGITQKDFYDWICMKLVTIVSFTRSD